MPARFSAYPPDAAAMVRLLEDDNVYRIGRSADCELRVEHHSVSRFHAELRRNADAWRLDDTASKNGLRVDGHLALHANLGKPTWFGVGDVYCWLEPLDATAAAAFRAHAETRRSASRVLSAQLGARQSIATLLPQALDAVLELSGLERGFVLYGRHGENVRVCASRGIQPSEITTHKFSGSATAVEKVLREARTVVCCDTLDSPWLGARPSVRLGGIRALMCVPLQSDGKPLGAIYADSCRPGPVLTELDLELVENLAQRATAALAAAEQLSGNSSRPGANGP